MTCPPRQWVRRLAAAGTSSATALLPLTLAPPAHADAVVSPSCAVSGDQLHVDLGTADGAFTVSRQQTKVVVTADGGGGPMPVIACVIPSTADAQGIQLVLSATYPHQWTLGYTNPYTAADGTSITNITLQPQPSDTVTLDGSGTTARHWIFQQGTTSDFDLDGVPATTELTLNSTNAIRMITGSGADVVDLTGFRNYDSAANLVQTGAGSDHVTGSDGADTLDTGDGNDVATGGGGPDTFIDGSGDDSYRGGTTTEPNDGAADEFDLYPHGGADSVNPGGTGDTSDFVVYDDRGTMEPVSVSLDGVANDGTAGEGDNIGPVGIVTTGGGDDTVAATGLTAVVTGAGDDRLIAPTSGTGTTWLAGEGTDTLDLSASSSAATGTLHGATQSVISTAGAETYAFDVENAIGTSHADTFTVDCGCAVRPGPGADSVHLGQDGASYVADAGVDGADTVTADDGVNGVADYSARTAAVSLTADDQPDDGTGAEGDDIGSTVATLIGGSAADTLVGSITDNELIGEAGNDALIGRGGDDRLVGGDGNDQLFGGSGHDTLLGQGGADHLLGGDGDDLLRGDDAGDTTTYGTDYLDGGNGDDDELGYAGNDTFGEDAAPNGSDLLIGGNGVDTASYALRTTRLSLSLNGKYDDGAAGEGDRIGTDVENLTAGKGADLIVGGAAPNLLLGGAGNDNFQTVGGGTDTLNGGSGTDKAHRDTVDKVTSVEKRY